jgi:SAM-dependent methyltransferase
VKRALALAVVVALAAGCAGTPTGMPGILFVATPEQVGIEMLKIAGVTRNDVVFDLGSGDGRLVIAAARDFGARGVGVELQAKLVQDSRENALKAGVADRTQFLWQDIFDTDISSATVITIYLSPALNLKLRPKLLALRPGTRIVSHDFDMGDWRPDRVQRVRGPNRDHRLYLWLVPADVAGVWRMRLGEREALLNLTQRYQVLGGTLALDGRELPVTDGRMAGARITFTAGSLTFDGRAGGETLEGRAGERPGPDTLGWSMRRVR